MIFVLIEADEGDTDVILVAQSRVGLMALVAQMYGEEIAEYADKKYAFARSNALYTGQERDALLAMLNQHQEWLPGRYILKNVEPHWQEWTLFICIDSGYGR